MTQHDKEMNYHAANPRDCPDCGLSARGGMHLCPKTEPVECREAFEKFCDLNDIYRGRHKEWHDQYELQETQLRWMGYQAAWNARATTRESAQPVECADYVRALELIASYPDANPISDAHYIARKVAREALLNAPKRESGGDNG